MIPNITPERASKVSAYDLRHSLATELTDFEYREAVAAEQMLNRSDGVVTDVWIAGTPAWRDSKATEHLGATQMGNALTVHTPV